MVKSRKYKTAQKRKISSSFRKKHSRVNHSKNEEGHAPSNSFVSNPERVPGLSGSGMKLPDNTLSYMERRFGVDFNYVRIHADKKSAQISSMLNARAFTYGSDIYFNKDKYDPESTKGKRLLAHELTHVIQQSGAIQTKLIQREAEKDQPGKDLEIDSCSGWEGDNESLTIAAAKHFFKTELDKDILVNKVECDPSNVLIMCKLTLTDGTIVNVHFNPKVNIVRVQLKDASGKISFCRYKYSCSSDGGITFTKIDCG